MRGTILLAKAVRTTSSFLQKQIGRGNMRQRWVDFRGPCGRRKDSKPDKKRYADAGITVWNIGKTSVN